MITNQLRNVRWGFDTPNVNALFQPLNAGIEAGYRDRQQGIENARADKQIGFQQQRLDMDQRRADREDEAAKVARMGKEAEAIHGMQGPARQQAWQAWTSRNPDVAARMQKFGLRADDHMTGPQFIATEAGTYDRQQRELQAAQIAQSRATTANIGQTDDIREFNFAERNGFTGNFEEWRKSKVNTNASQNITWGQDANGAYVPMQANRAGELVASKLPPNVVPVPNEVMAYRKAAATEQGQGAGKAVVDLPAVETSAQSMLNAIRGVENDKNLERMTGLNGWLPNVSPEARETQARIDQVQGKAFLQAFNSLRGGGAITEAEGAKATASLSRLQDLRVGTRAYKEALADLRTEIEALVGLARRKAAAGGPAPTVRGTGGQPVDLGNGITIRRID